VKVFVAATSGHVRGAATLTPLLVDDNEKLGIDPLPNYGIQIAPPTNAAVRYGVHIVPDGGRFNIVFSGKATRKEVTQNKNVKVLTIDQDQ
jgi:hypothetical protein